MIIDFRFFPLLMRRAYLYISAAVSKYHNNTFFKACFITV